MEQGVYPDGIEDEETSMYHKVALINFDELLTDVVKSGRTPDPKMFLIVEKMYVLGSSCRENGGSLPRAHRQFGTFCSHTTRILATVVICITCARELHPYGKGCVWARPTVVCRVPCRVQRECK